MTDHLKIDHFLDFEQKRQFTSYSNISSVFSSIIAQKFESSALLQIMIDRDHKGVVKVGLSIEFFDQSRANFDKL